MNKEIEVGSLEEAQEKLTELGKDTSVNKPTEEEVNAAVKEFNDKAAEYNSKQFVIGDAEKADEIYDFLLGFLENDVYWTKNGWMGVLKMHEEITVAKAAKKEGDSFQIGYHALEFLFYALTNPGGIGMKSARAIEKVADIYIEVMEIAGTTLEEAREQLKEIQWLQDKVSAMQQGFYLEREDGVVTPEGAEGFAAPTVDDLLKQ